MISILTSVKKMLGIAEDYEHFDMDLIIHINSVFFILTQLGVGPSEGFTIQDKNAVWSDFIPEEEYLESVKTYVYLKVRMIFDPPLSTTVQNSMTSLINEIESRLSIASASEQSDSEEVTLI